MIVRVQLFVYHYNRKHAYCQVYKDMKVDEISSNPANMNLASTVVETDMQSKKKNEGASVYIKVCIMIQ